MSFDTPQIASKSLPWGAVTSVAMINLCNSISQLIVYPLIGHLVRNYVEGITTQEIGYYSGFIEAMYQVGAAIGGVLFGYYSDNFGRRPALVIGLGSLATFSVLFGLARSFAMAVLMRFLCGISSGLVGVSKAALNDILNDPAYDDSTLKAKAYSMLTLNTGLGRLIGPLVGGLWILDGFKFPYLVSSVFNAAISGGTAILTFFYIKETLDAKIVEDSHARLRLFLSKLWQWLTCRSTKYTELRSIAVSSDVYATPTTLADLSSASADSHSEDEDVDAIHHSNSMLKYVETASVDVPISVTRERTESARSSRSLSISVRPSPLVRSIARASPSVRFSHSPRLPPSVGLPPPLLSLDPPRQVSVESVRQRNTTATTLSASPSTSSAVLGPVLLKEEDSSEEDNLNVTQFGGGVNSRLSSLLGPFRVLQDRTVFAVCMIYALVSMVGNAGNQVFSVYAMADREHGGFGADPVFLGMVSFYAGPPLLLFQLFLYPWCIKRMGVLGFQKWNMFLYAVSLSSVPLQTMAYEWGLRDERALNIMYTIHFSVVSILRVNSYSVLYLLVNNAAFPGEVGVVNGVAETMTALLRILGPTVFTVLFAVSVRDDSISFGFPLNFWLCWLLLSMITFGVFSWTCFLPEWLANKRPS